MNWRITFCLSLLTLIPLGYISAQHINEFHYENIGGDQDEFIEVAIQDPQPLDLTEFKIYLYNGSDSMEYDSRRLSGIVPACSDGWCYYIWSKQPFIQNGPDGIALVKETVADTTVFDFISYGGVITALDGGAIGVQSLNVGIVESNSSTPIGWSLQKRSDGTWFAGIATRGSINPIELLSFEAAYREDVKEVLLKWSTASELNNHYFEIQRSIDQRTFVSIAKIPGAGNSQEVLEYEFRDKYRLSGKVYYRLKQVDYGSSYSYSPLISIQSTEQLALEDMKPLYHLGALLFKEGNYRPGVEISLYNTVGQLLFHRKNIHCGEVVPVKLSGSGMVFFHMRSQGHEQSGRLFVVDR